MPDNAKLAWLVHGKCRATVGIVLKETKMQATTLTLKQVKAGDYIKRKIDAKAVFIKGVYDRATKSFSCIDTEDMNKEIFIKANKLVFIGFTY